MQYTRAVIGGGVLTAAAVVGGSAIVACRRRELCSPQVIDVEASVWIDRPSEELYRYWRCFENLPHFIGWLQSVTEVGRYSHWIAKPVAGYVFEWDCELVDEEESHFICWRSVPDSPVTTEGFVRFGGPVAVSLRFHPPATRRGMAVAAMLGENPAWRLNEDLRCFKLLMEAAPLS